MRRRKSTKGRIAQRSSDSSADTGNHTIPRLLVDGPSWFVFTPTPTPVQKVTLKLPQRTLTLSELQRLKRQFVTVHKKAITLGTVEKGAVDWSEAGVAGKFGRWLEENVRA